MAIKRSCALGSKGSGMIVTDPEVFDIGVVRNDCSVLYTKGMHDGNNTWVSEGTELALHIYTCD
jgi:hypothetical protein